MDRAEFRRLRLAARLTQAGAADALEVTQRTVARWESGESAIDALRAEAIRLRLARRYERPARQLDSE